MDTAVATDWVANILARLSARKVFVGFFYLLADNHTAQESVAFKVEHSSTGGLPYFGLRNGPEIWQPVDSAEVAQVLKTLVVNTP